MATNVSAQAQLRAKRSLSSYAMPVIGGLLILGLIFLLAKNVQHDGFSYFASISFIWNTPLFRLSRMGQTAFVA